MLEYDAVPGLDTTSKALKKANKYAGSGKKAKVDGNTASSSSGTSAYPFRPFLSYLLFVLNAALVLSPFVEAELLARARDAASGETDYTQDPVALEHALGHVRSELHNYSFRIQYELQQYDNANQSIQKLQEALDRVRISRK